MDRPKTTRRSFTRSFADGVGAFALLVDSGSRPASLDAAIEEVFGLFKGEHFESGPNGYIYLYFSRPSQAVQAAVRVISKMKSRVVGAIIMSETDASGTDLSAIKSCLDGAVALGESGQLLIALAAHEIIRSSLDTEYTFDELGNFPIRSDGGHEKLLLVQHPSIPKIEKVYEPRRGLFRTATFIGREREISALRRQLDLSRMVTIVGPAGIGKTALIHRLIAEIDSDFADGVHYIDFGPIARESMLLPTIIRLLGVAKLPGEDNIDALVAHFREKRALIVFDKCEHLTAPVRRLVDVMLSECSNLAILAGSQSTLKALGEDRFPLGGLEVPSPVEDWRSIREYESVALFVDRAQLANHNFVFDEAVSSSVANLCRRLDGIPLAIELAATKTSILNPKQIVDRLDHRFILLQDRQRDPSDRHQTLLSTIDWSYGLLDACDKALLRRLSVFAGAFSLEQAEQVCAFDDELRKNQVFHAFEKLVDSSFLSVSSVQTVDKRFFLTETMRLYAKGKLLDAKEEKELARRHREWCAEFAATADRALIGPDQTAWIERMDASYEDVRTVIEAGFQKGGDAMLSVETLISCYRFFFLRHYLWEGLRLVEKAIACKECSKSPQFPRVVNLAGALSNYLGDIKQARRYVIQSFVLSRQNGNKEGIGSALVSLAINAQENANLRKSRRYYVRATVLFRKERVHQKLFVTLMNVLGVEADLGMIEDAHAHLEEALTLQDEVNDPYALAQLHQNAAHLYLVEDKPYRTIAYTLECLPMFERLRNHTAVAASWRTAAHAVEKLGRYESAAIFLGAARKQSTTMEARLRTYDVESLDDLSQRLIGVLGEQLFRSQMLIGSLMSIAQLTQELDKIRHM